MSYTLFVLIDKLLNIYQWLIVIWCLMSWLPRTGGLLDDIRGAIGTLVEPYLNVFRRLIPPVMMIDFSPVVALFALTLIERLLYGLLL